MLCRSWVSEEFTLWGVNESYLRRNLESTQYDPAHMEGPMLKTACYGLLISTLVAIATTLTSDTAAGQAPAAAPVIPVVAPVLPPSRVVDLTTTDGMASVSGQWKNMDAKIVEVPAM